MSGIQFKKEVNLLDKPVSSLEGLRRRNLTKQLIPYQLESDTRKGELESKDTPSFNEDEDGSLLIVDHNDDSSNHESMIRSEIDNLQDSDDDIIVRPSEFMEGKGTFSEKVESLNSKIQLSQRKSLISNHCSMIGSDYDKLQTFGASSQREKDSEDSFGEDLHSPQHVEKPDINDLKINTVEEFSK